jgi:peptidylprolyl isomerase
MTLSKPTVEVPAGAAPTDLEITDITVGEGPEAAPGHRVSVQYVGVAYSTGTEFDSSWSRNEPFEFALGAGHVIAGWDRGVAGMKVGGRRRLVIPAKLGYGDRGAGGVIKPGETLIFVVDLLGVR